MRYHDSIELITDIPDELSEYQIPKLTLQPVVENSILHGILEKESKSGTIVITGWMENEDVVLLISDDGVGISPEILSTILSGKEKASPEAQISQFIIPTGDSKFSMEMITDLLIPAILERVRRLKSGSLHIVKSNLRSTKIFTQKRGITLYEYTASCTFI
mgnify:FL=1